MSEYYILVQPWAVYVKEKSFFESQGGLTEDWGKTWQLIQADSIEHARAIGYTTRRTMASRENSGYDNPTTWAKGEANVGNGPQTGFTTGATRSTSEGKIDYEGHISPRVLHIFGEYMHDHRVQRDGKVRASDNWQEGIPVYRYVKSLIRHTEEFWTMWRGDTVVNPDSDKPFTFRDVLCAILFNTMGILFELSREGMAPLQAPHVTTDLRKEFEREDQPKQAEEERLCGIKESEYAWAAQKEQFNATTDVAVERERVVGRAGQYKPSSVTDVLVYEGTLEALGDHIRHNDLPTIPGKRYRITREA
jgi:hypothetical protein